MKRDDLLDLNDALQHPGRRIAVDLTTDLPEESEIDLVTPIDGFLEAYSTGNLLVIEGEFKARCLLECARCGAPLEQDVTFQVEEDFPVEGVPSVYAQDDHARVVPDEPYELFDENKLMVENLLRQALIVSLPVAPLCTYGWDGPCPEAARRGVDRPVADGHVGLMGLGQLLEDRPDTEPDKPKQGGDS